MRKDDNLCIRISHELKKEFKKACDKKNTVMSEQVLKFMKTYIKRANKK